MHPLSQAPPNPPLAEPPRVEAFAPKSAPEMARMIPHEREAYKKEWQAYKARIAQAKPPEAAVAPPQPPAQPLPARPILGPQKPPGAPPQAGAFRELPPSEIEKMSARPRHGMMPDEVLGVFRPDTGPTAAPPCITAPDGKVAAPASITRAWSAPSTSRAPSPSLVWRVLYQ